MITIRPRLREYLAAHDLTPYRLAQKIQGMKPATIYAIAAGRRRPSLDALEIIIGALRELTGKRTDLTDVLELQDGPEVA